MFIPTNWDKDPSMVGLMYKHKLRMGKQFQLTVRPQYLLINYCIFCIKYSMFWMYSVWIWVRA